MFAVVISIVRCYWTSLIALFSSASKYTKCREIDNAGIQSLGKSKPNDIIDSIKPTQQKTVAGLDEFIVEGIEAWQSLSSSKIVRIIEFRIITSLSL